MASYYWSYIGAIGKSAVSLQRHTKHFWSHPTKPQRNFFLCSGNLLEDTALLSSLNDTKVQASSVASALDDGRALAAQLDEQRSVYRYLQATHQPCVSAIGLGPVAEAASNTVMAALTCVDSV